MQDKKAIFNSHWEKFGISNGFDSHKKFMADQKHKRGTYKEMTREYVEANPNGWSDIDEDILVTTAKVPGVVIGHPVADCPVITMLDSKQGIAAVGHCSADLIDKKMPMMIADVLTQNYGTREENINIIIGAHAGSNWTYDSYPTWATDKDFWKDCIIEENGVFKIDLDKAMIKQFMARGLGECHLRNNTADTITDPRYYSNSAQRNNPIKFGRQFEGVFFAEEKEIKEKVSLRK